MESKLDAYSDIIRSMINNGFTDEQVPDFLLFECGISRGASKVNIRCFCAEWGLKRVHVQDSQLEAEVAKAINEVNNIIIIIMMIIKS